VNDSQPHHIEFCLSVDIEKVAQPPLFLFSVCYTTSGIGLVIAIKVSLDNRPLLLSFCFGRRPRVSRHHLFQRFQEKETELENCVCWFRGVSQFELCDDVRACVDVRLVYNGSGQTLIISQEEAPFY
jgi:hypothetical protein